MTNVQTFGSDSVNKKLDSKVPEVVSSIEPPEVATRPVSFTRTSFVG